MSVPRITLTTKEAARSVGVSEWTIYQWIKLGRLRSVKVGGRRLVPVEALQDMADGRAPGPVAAPPDQPSEVCVWSPSAQRTRTQSQPRYRLRILVWQNDASSFVPLAAENSKAPADPEADGG